MANICGVDDSNIAKLEVGKYNISIEVLTKILEPLGYKLEIVKAADWAAFTIIYASS